MGSSFEDGDSMGSVSSLVWLSLSLALGRLVKSGVDSSDLVMASTQV